MRIFQDVVYQEEKYRREIHSASMIRRAVALHGADNNVVLSFEWYPSRCSEKTQRFVQLLKNCGYEREMRCKVLYGEDKTSEGIAYPVYLLCVLNTVFLDEFIARTSSLKENERCGFSDALSAIDSVLGVGESNR